LTCDAASANPDTSASLIFIPIDAKQGDWAYFNPMIATKYQINNKPFVIVQQSQLLGVDIPD